MAERIDPYRNYNFALQIENVTHGYFTDITGFGASTDPIEYNEGGSNFTTLKIPGRTKYTNIVLKWGMTDSRDLWDWYQGIIEGRIQRRDGSIVVYDVDGFTEKARWNFVKAWPTKWDGPDFSAKGNEIAIETLELAHEGIFRGE
jgi:phage tail-like protein